jgi:hypothetical protein
MGTSELHPHFVVMFVAMKKNSTGLERYEYIIGRWGGKEFTVPYLCDVSNLHSKPFK